MTSSTNPAANGLYGLFHGLRQPLFGSSLGPQNRYDPSFYVSFLLASIASTKTSNSLYSTLCMVPLTSTMNTSLYFPLSLAINPTSSNLYCTHSLAILPPQRQITSFIGLLTSSTTPSLYFPLLLSPITSNDLPQSLIHSFLAP
jgi:hypothetical protein